MIARCTASELDQIYSIINDSAKAYQDVIPSDRWHDPYMSHDELQNEILAGVDFWGYRTDTDLSGVMGIQNVQDVTLIRHAYVRTSLRNKGIGKQLLQFLLKQTSRPVLIGTWKAAVWAIEFYKRNGFVLVNEKTKRILLKTYWTIPERQIETSVVLADQKWIDLHS